LSLNLVRLTGTFLNGSSQPLNGQLVFAPNVQLTDSTDSQVVADAGVVVSLDSGGSFSVPLYATDNENLTPSGWVWDVTVSVAGLPPASWSFFLPYTGGSAQDISTLTPAVAATPMSAYLLATGGVMSGTLGLDGTPPIKLPAGTSGDVLMSDAEGNITLQPGGSGDVTSVNTQTGVVVLTAADVGADASGAAAAAQTAAESFATSAVATETGRAETAEGLLAPKASPAFTGVPAAPTASALTDSTQVATTAYADSAVAVEKTRAEAAEALLAPLANPAFTGTVTVPTPTASTEAVTKAYADAIASGLSARESVNEATTAALSPGYTFTSTSGGTLTATTAGVLVVDTVTVALNDRVLVQNETGGNAPYNGIYVCTTAGASGVAYVLTRSTDMNTAADFPGAVTFCEGGTDNKGSGFVCITPSGLTLNTTAITWTQNSATGSVTAGTGLTQTGPVISLTSPVPVSLGGTGANSGTPAPANEVFAGPSGSTGAPAFRALVAADVPTLNQSTTGTASNITDTLDQVPHAAASVNLNSNKITNLANGSGAQDGAAFGQLPSGSNLLPVGSGGTGAGSASGARTNLGLGAAAVLGTPIPAADLPGPSQWLNAVTQYGASTSASASLNTTNIQDALTAAGTAGGGVVYLPAGTYAVTNLTLPTGVTLLGDGPGATVLSAGAGTTGAVIALTTPATTRKTCVRDLLIECNSISGLTGISLINTGLSSEYPGQHRLYNVIVQDAGQDAFSYGSGSTGTLIETMTIGCTAYNSGRYGFNIQSSATDSRWVSCTTGPSVSHGFMVIGSSNHFSCCKAYYAGYSGSEFTSTGCGWYVGGISTYPTMGITFDGCEAQDCAQQGWTYVPVSPQPMTSLLMVGCTIDSCNAYGYTGSAGAAIATSGVTYSTIAGCTAWNRSGGAGMMTYGISVAGTQTGLTIAGNGFDFAVSESTGPFAYVSGYGYLLAEPYEFDLTGVSGSVKVPSVVQAPASAQALSNGTTITLNLAYAAIPLTATAAVTGIILAAAANSGQTVTLINQSAYTVTFAASGTSNVADGTGDVIAAGTAGQYVWDGSTSLWYRQGASSSGAGGGSISAGTGLSLSGSTMSLVTPVTTGDGGTGGPGSAGQVLATNASGAVAWADAPVDWINAVTQYGASTSASASANTTAINAALAAAVPGQVVYLPAGVYSISGPLTLPRGVILKGTGVFTEGTSDTTFGSVLMPTSGFTGSQPVLSVIWIPDEHTSGASLPVTGCQVSGITVDGGNLVWSGEGASETINGITAYGTVNGLIIDDCRVHKMSGWGIQAIPYTASSVFYYPDGHKYRRTYVHQNKSGGLQIHNCPDSTFMDIYSFVNNNDAWDLQPGGNSVLIGCRGEDSVAIGSAGNGFNIHGVPGSPDQSIISLIGCSSNGNGLNGLLLNGTTQVNVIGGFFTEDGQGGTGYAAIAVTAQSYPVIITGVSTCTEVVSSVNGPSYGFSVTGTSKYVEIGSSFLWGATSAIHDDGTNSVFYGPGLIAATGTPASPTYLMPPGGAGTLSVFNVMHPEFGATGNGTTDDTAAIAAALTAAAGGGIVYFPPGIYLVSSPLQIGALTGTVTGITILGAGPQASVLKGSSSFPHASGDQYGVLQFGSTAFTSSGATISGCRVADIGFDMTAVNDSVTNQVNAIFQDYCLVTDLVIEHIWYSGQTNGCCVMLNGLGRGQGSGQWAHGITIRDVYALNGAGTVCCYSNANATGSVVSSIEIANIQNYVSVTGVADDRVVISSNAGAAGYATVRDITIRDVFVDVASTATGTVNGVKLDAASFGQMQNVLISGVHYYANPSSSAYSYPVIMYSSGLTASGSESADQANQGYLQDWVVENVCAQYSKGMMLFLNRFTNSPQCVVRNVVMENCQDGQFLVQLTTASAAAGDESIIFDSISGYAKTTTLPFGIQLCIPPSSEGGTSSMGANGLILARGLMFTDQTGDLGYGIASTQSQANSGAQASAYSNIIVRDSNLSACTTPVSLANTYTIRNVVGAADYPVVSAETLTAVGSSGSGTVNLNPATAAVFTVSLTGDPTYTFTSPPSGESWSFTLIQTQGSGPYSVTWPSSVYWQDAIPPTLSSTSGAIDVFVFTTVDGGSIWLGSVAGLNYIS
jgi:hypothetical protein